MSTTGKIKHKITHSLNTLWAIFKNSLQKPTQTQIQVEIDKVDLQEKESNPLLCSALRRAFALWLKGNKSRLRGLVAGGMDVAI